MYNIILIRYGEIGVKGKNRSYFVDKLIENIKWSLRDIKKFKIEKTYGRIYLHCDQDYKLYIERLSKVPGIVSFSPTAVCNLEFEDLKKLSLKVFKDAVNEYPTTFKVETRRPNKKFPLKSPEISREIGAHILKNINENDNNKLSVDVHNPKHTLNIEVRKNNIYVYTRIISGPGGLPVGSSGRGLLLLSGGLDSPVAGWLGMRRGIKIDALYFHSFPYTSDRAKEKVIDLARILANYGGTMKLFVSYFTDIQKAIQQKCPSKYNVTVMRRMMLRIATQIASEYNYLTLLTGESVGQVASQTLHSMHAINAVTSIPILRPLITTDKSEIMDIARDIGTYDTSILPYEDCCTIFVPKHPVIKPGIKDTDRAEANLEVDKLINESLTKNEIIQIEP